MPCFPLVPDNFWALVMVGFAAQLIDGSLGMAYGVSCNSFLLSIGGLSASRASATIHTAEIFTTLASGLAHWREKNVDIRLFWRLVLTGCLGGATGAFFVSHWDNAYVRPIVCVYLIFMGLRIMAKAFAPQESNLPVVWTSPLGFVGGLMDAIGGGGWGPIVTSTLLASGKDPRLTIGSVNAAEFFVTISEVVTFAAFISLEGNLANICALVLGGIAAAPLGAKLCHILPVKPILLLVGLLVISLNVWSLSKLV